MGLSFVLFVVSYVGVPPCGIQKSNFHYKRRVQFQTSCCSLCFSLFAFQIFHFSMCFLFSQLFPFFLCQMFFLFLVFHHCFHFSAHLDFSVFRFSFLPFLLNKCPFFMCSCLFLHFFVGSEHSEKCFCSLREREVGPEKATEDMRKPNHRARAKTGGACGLDGTEVTHQQTKGPSSISIPSKTVQNTRNAYASQIIPNVMFAWAA